MKRVDREQQRITIVTADGTDIECRIVPRTRLEGTDRQAIALNALAPQTRVMFKTEERGPDRVLVGLRVATPDDAKKAGNGGNRFAGVPAPPPPSSSLGIKPLTELGEGKYKGETGGLYGQGRNEPPAAQQAAARAAAARIEPLDPRGQPSADGKIVLLAVGMSNTTQEFSLFKRLSDADPQRSGRVVVVDGAQGGQAAEQWNDPHETGKRVWETVAQRLQQADVTAEQVQVVWIKQALIGQGRFGEFPAHAKKLAAELVETLGLLKQRFPNLELAYLSSRIYAGYATTPLNPEPYAYEGAFAVRWVIERQIAGDAALNADASRGAVKAPVVLWGPYLWGDGTTPRADGLVWNRDDLVGDGTHPSPSGRKKVADLLLAFFHSDPYAKAWYLKDE